MRTLTILVQAVALISVSMAANFQSTPPPARTSPVAVGEIAPDFKLEDHNGRKVSLAESRDKNSVVLVFYRGYW